MTRDPQTAPTVRPIRVAWYHPVIPHYRVPVINRLGEQADLEVTVFAGQQLTALTLADAAGALTTPVVRLRNVAFFRSRLPIAVGYATGWTRMLRPRQDAVIALEWSRDLVLWGLLATRRLFGFKLVLLGHIRLQDDDGPVRLRLRRFLVRAADGVIAYTEDGRQQAIAWGVAPSAVVAMGNTLDDQPIARAKAAVTDARIAQLRAELHLDGPVFLFVGRPIPAKRLDVAIDAMRLLADRGKRAHLIVVGTSSELPRLVERAAGLDTVHFLGAVHDEDNLAAYFTAADLVLIPGAVGLVANHAFAYGRPLVTAHGQPHGPEIVLARDGENALFVDTCDPPAFASALESLLRAPERLQDLRRGADATVVPTMVDMVGTIAHLIRNVTRANGRP